MFTEIKAGDKTLQLLSNAATPYRFKQVFGIDLIKIIIGAAKKPIDDAESSDLAVRLAFIMSKQAAGEELNKLNEEAFFTWLEGYDLVELHSLETVIKIWEAYTGQVNGDSKPKKKSVRQKEK